MKNLDRGPKHFYSHILRISRIWALLVKLWLGMRWRIWRVIEPVYYRRWEAVYWLAACYRAVMLRRVVFIGITGSCGKTTAKELIAAVLSSRFKGRKNSLSRNLPDSVAMTIFSVRPWDKFCVQEVSISKRGDLRKSLRMVKPQIGVVTNIGADHLSAFGSVEEIAAEKGQLIEVLPPNGTAILNADDANVLAMRTKFAGRLITYGLAPDAMLRAEDIRCSWPERLSFSVHYDGQSQVVQTQLCGSHWVPCALAAIAVGVAMRVPLATAAQAVQMVPPFNGRMQLVDHPDGVTFIRDDYKAPLWTIPPALDFLKQAKAKRKIAVVGTLSDYRGDAAGKYVKVARQALEVADYVFFVGRWASRCLRAKRHSEDNAVRAFSKVEDISEFLKGFLRPGDLVLLKGREGVDDLVNIIEACSSTSLQPRSTTSITYPTSDNTGESHTDRPLGSLPDMPTAESERPVQAILGLGNPGEEYRHTRHNVGQRVLDVIAKSLGGEWTREDQAMLARVQSQGEVVYLIKALTQVNNTGPMLLRLADRLGFGPDECILVYDDLDFAPGDVRLRMKGGAGGHNGVRSIIDAFQSERFRRIRIGIGRPQHRDQITKYVLEEFSDLEHPKIERACAEAADRVLELVRTHALKDRILEAGNRSTD